MLGVHVGARQGASKAVGVVEQVQHRRYDQCTDQAANDQHHLLAPGRGADQVAGLQILQVVIRDRGHGQHDGGGEQRHGHTQLATCALQHVGRHLLNQQQHQRHQDGGDDAYARDGAGR